MQSPEEMIDGEEFLSRRDSGCSPPDPADGGKEQARQHKRKEQNRTAFVSSNLDTFFRLP